jgi:hypothetical protein
VTLMSAGRLSVHHDDESVTVYVDVRYWLTGAGVTVYDGAGELVAEHGDVVYTSVG